MTLRIGIVGAGANTRSRHIPGFQEIDGVEVVAVCNRSRESGQKAADEFGIPTVYDNWKQLVEADDVDAVCVGTWPYLHCDISIATLEANKHILTEARMAMNLEEARRMQAAAAPRPRVACPAASPCDASRSLRACPRCAPASGSPAARAFLRSPQLPASRVSGPTISST